MVIGVCVQWQAQLAKSPFEMQKARRWTWCQKLAFTFQTVAFAVQCFSCAKVASSIVRVSRPAGPGLSNHLGC